MSLANIAADRLLLYRIFLAGFFVWWGWTIAAGDLRSKKIPNRMVLTGLAVAAAALLLYLLETLLGRAGYSADYLRWNFYGYYLFNLAVPWGVGIFLWYGEVWPAGDAKFFMASLALLPLLNFQIRGFPRTLWFSVLINSFVLGAVYYVLRFLLMSYRGYKSKNQDLQRKWAGIRAELAAKAGDLRGGGIGKSGFYAASLFFVFLLHQVASAALRGELQRLVPDLGLLFFLLFIGWDKFSRLLSGPKFRWALWLASLGYLTYGMINFRDRLLLDMKYSGLSVLKFSVILGAGRFLLVYLMEKFSTVEVPAAEVAPGMILSRRYTDIIQRDEFFSGSFADSFRDGISQEEADLLREWGSRIPKENPKIEVMAGTPFAVWIFAGALFQVVFNGNFFTWLRRLAGLG